MNVKSISLWEYKCWMCVSKKVTQAATWHCKCWCEWRAGTREETLLLEFNECTILNLFHIPCWFCFAGMSLVARKCRLIKSRECGSKTTIQLWAGDEELRWGLLSNFTPRQYWKKKLLALQPVRIVMEAVTGGLWIVHFFTKGYFL